MATAIDTSVVISALLSWHADHERASRWLAQQLGGNRLILPDAVLVEAYAVMTRLPSPHRLSPEDAFALLDANFRGVRSAGLPSKSIWKVLTDVADRHITGGAVYDAMILECSIRAGAKAIATFNVRDFERLSEGRIAIIEPD